MRLVGADITRNVLEVVEVVEVVEVCEEVIVC